MRKFERSATPEVLNGRWQQWGLDWKNRREANSGAQFHWHVVDGVAVNQTLLVPLKQQTQSHCAFCDNFPVSPPSMDTIEHLRPKALFPLEAYRWDNLYYCCMHCQVKGTLYDDAVVRPDSVDYTFDRYFRWDHTLGTLEVNDQASPSDQAHARLTIEYHRLNVGHPSLRKRELIRRARCQDQPLDDFAYRGYVE